MKTYKYGILEPTHNAELVDNQICYAHRYRNKLVEIELQRRESTDTVMREKCPGLVEVEAEIQDLDSQIATELSRIKRENSDTRTRGATSGELQSMRRTLKEKRSVRRKLRQDYFSRPETQEALQAVNDRAQETVRESRAACGCFWGTYLIVEQAADSFRKGAPPVFKKYHGEGRIGLQLQGGLSWEDIIAGNDSRLRIIPTPQTEPRQTKSGKVLPMPSEKRLRQQYTLWMRVGSEGRKPVWATFPLILHRHPPKDAVIKWAIVKRTIIAGKVRWSLLLTIQADAFDQPAASKTGVVGIDVGYRLLPHGLRVAYTHGDDKAGRELKLPMDMVNGWRKVEDLQSIRDQRHNEIRADLRQWMDGRDVPEWLREATRHMHTWRRLSRLDHLVRQWGEQRFDGDEQVYDRLCYWRKKERHLWQYQENLRDQLQARRRDVFRKFAVEIRERYSAIIVEKLDLRELHDVLRPQDEQEVPSTIRWCARMANLSLLRQCLNESGCAVIEVPAENTTAMCHACQQINHWDQARNLRHRCDHCGAEWDQDDNAARNLLASGQAMKKSPASLEGEACQGVASTNEGNGDKKKRSRSERLRAARTKHSKSC